EAGNEPFDHELMREQVELGTAPHTSVAELGTQLLALRQELSSASDRRGVQLVAAASSPIDAGSTVTDVDRYRRMMDEFAVVARQQLTCGMHVHVSVDSPEEGVAVLDRLRPWLPVLTALSANSPFLAGRDTGYESYRSLLWGQWPTAGPVEPFGDVAGYERAREDLIASGAAMDDGMIYFDARLSARYPTVEIRVADVVPWVADAVLIAALARAFVHTAAARWEAGEPVEPVRTDLLRAANWRAARWGMTGDLADAVVGGTTPAWKLVEAAMEWCGAALLEAGDLDRVRSSLDEISRRGTGASLQRRAFDQAGEMGPVLDALRAQMLIYHAE
ncbi:MAG: putative glutamate--cysteine ligase 2, partial [Pseudonocardiales bacterium]|nr:putative glutamate--cysteine ligase 2 [Pseudonocardiales bacterium]